MWARGAYGNKECSGPEEGLGEGAGDTLATLAPEEGWEPD